ncbi:hypothetical protein [Nocardiopsis alba]|uniref:hypothetical protein n=1 Tax=Nocardiopsis alba TaxID=53437 RepID=UPI003D7055C8
MTCVDIYGTEYAEHNVPNPDAPEGDADRLCDQCMLDPEKEEEEEAARYDIYGEELPTEEELAIEAAIEGADEDEEY